MEDELCTIFCVSDLDTDFCKNAGSIGNVEISALKLNAYTGEDKEIGGTFDISFSESYYNGRRDISWKLPWSGTGSLLIQRDTGEMRIRIIAERLPEEDNESRGRHAQ